MIGQETFSKDDAVGPAKGKKAIIQKKGGGEYRRGLRTEYGGQIL